MERLARYSKFQLTEKRKDVCRLIELVEINFNMALLQAQRIAEDKEATDFPRATPGLDSVAIFNLFADIHFFLVSADNVRKALDKLNRRFDGALNHVLKKYKFFFEPVRAIRGYHEHLEQRITGQPFYAGKALKEDWTYEMCGASLKVGPATARLLIRMYRAVEEALKYALDR